MSSRKNYKTINTYKALSKRLKNQSSKPKRKYFNMNLKFNVQKNKNDRSKTNCKSIDTIARWTTASRNK